VLISVKIREKNSLPMTILNTHEDEIKKNKFIFKIVLKKYILKIIYYLFFHDIVTKRCIVAM
jgi:hypothetical protein